MIASRPVLLDPAIALRGIALALAAYAAFSTADALIKLASARFGVFQIAFTMAFFALVPVTLLTRGQGGLASLVPRRPRPVLLRAVLSVVGMNLAWSAFARLPLAEGYAILFAAPLLITVLSVPLLGEAVGWRRWLAVGAGFIGVVVMIDPSFSHLGIGHAMAAGAALCGSLSFIILRRIGPGETSGALLTALFLTLLVATAPGALAGWVMPAPGELFMMAMAGLLLGSGQAGIVFATRAAPAAVIAPFQYTQMVWAMVFGLLVFGDSPSLNLFLGLAIVVASGLYIVWRETIRRRPVTLGGGRAEVPARIARQ